MSTNVTDTQTDINGLGVLYVFLAQKSNFQVDLSTNVTDSQTDINGLGVLHVCPVYL